MCSSELCGMKSPHGLVASTYSALNEANKIHAIFKRIKHYKNIKNSSVNIASSFCETRWPHRIYGRANPIKIHF